ncbi:MAG: phosphatase PAP2 family protein [Actinomycetota bacterium]|nr:phosphatase PAP2 family protein [Actinomycetota bacterium]
MSEPEDPADPRRPAGLRWWKEVLYIAAFYGVYSAIRNTQGSATVSAAHAFAHARNVIHVERGLGLFFEERVQEAFLGWRPFIQFWNLFYGTFHFVVTIVALVLLFRRFPARYPRWRNTLAATTGLALIGFATYPLMPPRLLPASYGFVDTLRVYGGLWSFESGPVAQVSNQYAAMPSLHFAWSAWSAFVLYPMLVRPWARVAVLLYPAATLFAIVVTANHYWLDAAGGALILGVGSTAGFALAAATSRHPTEEAVPNRASLT